MADVKWIKLVTDVFNNKKIKQIDSMPEADTILVIWFKLLCLAGNINENGLIILTKDIPYTDEMLATEFNKPINIIRLALKTFEAFGMIELVENIYYISNWEKYQNVEGLDKIKKQTRKRVQRFREKQKELPCNATCNVTVTQCNATDIDIDKELDKDVVIDKIKETPESFYNNNIAPITQFVVDDILNFINDGFEEAFILRMMQEAVKNEKRNWKYISTSLFNNGNKGIKTLEQYEANEAKRNREKQNERVSTQSTTKYKDMSDYNPTE